MTLLFPILLSCLVMTAATLPALEWEGKCTHVSDGDTITVFYHELPLKVRLYGIDAPERKQDFNRKSGEHLKNLVLDKVVTVELIEFDKYNRVVGMVRVDDKSINAAMLEAGLAWVYDKFCDDPHLSEWKALEQQARESGVGIWSHPNPTPPWRFRRLDCTR